MAGFAFAQTAPFEIGLRDGRVVVASEIAGDPQQGLEIVVQGQPQHLAGDELLFVSAGSAHPADLPTVFLAGGDQVHGAVVGGDAAGDRLELLSPMLGRLQVPVDRIAALAVAGFDHALRLQLPEGVGEGLFLRAAVGYDLLAGTLHQFGELGVRFQPSAAASPRWYGLRDFVALCIAEAVPRPDQPNVHLLTRAADRLGIACKRFAAKSVQCELEGGTVVELRLADFACATFLGAGTFASDLVPSEVLETGFDGEVVYPWRRDEAALGGPLLVAGRAYGKGLGVHSKSRLSFRTPDGCVAFCTRVGVDDSAVDLRAQANVEVRVLKNGEVVFAQKDLGPGQAPRSTGLVPVAPGDTVTLEVDFGRGRELGDRVDWLVPVFLPRPGRRP